KRFLFYAALELRLGIETLIWEYLFYLTKGGVISTRAVKEYQPDRIKHSVLKICPDFVERFEFANHVYKIWGATDRLAIPNLKKLTQLHGKLSRFLHRSPTWVSFLDKKEFDRLTRLIKRVEKLLNGCCTNNLFIWNFNEFWEGHFTKYKKTKSKAYFLKK